MIPKKFFTTGEAAELLTLSRSTVSRKFDKGVLFGRKHQITGERLVSRESVEAFLKQYNLPVAAVAVKKKRVLLGTSDERLQPVLQKIFPKDERVQIERVDFGGDVLIGCSKEHPDLLIIDEELPDIPCAEIIKSLRRTEDQSVLKILCCCTPSHTEDCLEWGANEAWAKDGLEGELAQKIYSLLDMPEEGPSETQTFGYRRRWPRMAIRFPAKIWVYPLSARYVRDPGKAVLEDISYGGAYLSEIRMEKGIIPGEPFRFFLEINHPPLVDWRAHCRVVRLQSNGSLSAGVQFVRLYKSARRMLQTVFQH